MIYQWDNFFHFYAEKPSKKQEKMTGFGEDE